MHNLIGVPWMSTTVLYLWLHCFIFPPLTQAGKSLRISASISLKGNSLKRGPYFQVLVCKWLTLTKSFRFVAATAQLWWLQWNPLGKLWPQNYSQWRCLFHHGQLEVDIINNVTETNPQILLYKMSCSYVRWFAQGGDKSDLMRGLWSFDRGAASKNFFPKLWMNIQNLILTIQITDSYSGSRGLWGGCRGSPAERE